VTATYRDATPADVPHVARLVRGLAEYERELERFTATEADFHRVLFEPGPRAYAILAEIPNHPPVGVALFYHTINTFMATTALFLEDLFVEPPHRGLGLGLGLMRAVATRTVKDGCGWMEWRVLNWNQPAIDFYEKLGARPIEKWHVRQLHGAALTALANGDNQHG
jgi:GNAT superfamily N-acetyltransferase